MVEAGDESDDDDEDDSDEVSSDEDEATPKKVCGYSYLIYLLAKFVKFIGEVYLFFVLHHILTSLFSCLFKVEISKKRPVESATKTPIPEKKAKLVPQSGQKSGDFSDSVNDKMTFDKLLVHSTWLCYILWLPISFLLKKYILIHFCNLFPIYVRLLSATNMCRF